MTEKELKDAIIKRVGTSSFSAWRIGLTQDLDERKKYWKETEKEDIQYWTNWTADSLTIAQNVESYFINEKGMKGGTGGGGLVAGATTYVYIF
jgi:hypothetical protein